MSVRPYKKKKAKQGETWWIIDLGRNAKPREIPHCGSYEEAKRQEIALKTMMAGQKKEVGSSSRIKDYIVPFLKWYKNESSPKTVRDIRFSINLYIVPYFGNYAPMHLTVDLFNRFKGDLLDKGLSPTTINKHLNYFSSILRWAEEHGHCKPLTFKIPKFPKKRTTPKEATRPLTERQLNAIYKHIQPQYRLLFLLMADHGLRLDEALNMQIDDIDETRKQMSVLGKGNKRRLVPFMSERFEEELEIAVGDRLHGPLVVNPETGEQYRTMWKELKRAANAAGLQRKINHHILRHTFATLAAENRMDAHALQRILGHSSLETTNKIYTQVGVDFVGREANEYRQRRGV